MVESLEKKMRDDFRRENGWRHLHAGAGAALMLALVGTGFAATPDSWKTAANGNWGDGTNWSLGTAANSGDDALIAATGGAYQVTVNANTTVNSLTLDGSANVSTSLVIPGSQTLTTNNGLTLNAATVHVGDASGAGTLTSALSGNGTIVFDGGTMASPSVVNLFVIPSGITLNSGAGSGSIPLLANATESNAGTLSAQTAGEGITISNITSFTNTGTLEASNGGTLTLAFNQTSNGSYHFSNTGTISASNGGILAFTGSVSSQGLPPGNILSFGNIQASNSTLEFSIDTSIPGGINIPFDGNTVVFLPMGFLTESSLTLDGPTTSLHLAGGTFHAAESSFNLTATNGATVIADPTTSATTSHVEWLTLNNTSISLRSATISFSAANADSFLTPGITPAIGGTGELVLDGTDSQNNIIFTSASGLNPFINSGITIRTGTAGGSITSLVSSGGVISSQTPGMDIHITQPTFTSTGLLEAINGGTLHLTTTSKFSNAGELHAGAGSTIFLSRLTDTSASETVIDLDSINSFGLISGSGGMTLNGSLLLSLADGYVPQISDSWTFMTSSVGVIGQFAAVSSSSPAVVFSVSYGGQSAEATVVAVPEPASLGLLGLGAAVLLRRRRGGVAKAVAGNFHKDRA